MNIMQVADGKRAIFEKMQIDDRDLRGAIPRKPPRSAPPPQMTVKVDDEVRFEPIVALAFVEHDLQRAEAQRQQAQADIIDSESRRRSLRFKYGGSSIERVGQQQRNDADRHVDVRKSSASCNCR